MEVQKQKTRKQKIYLRRKTFKNQPKKMSSFSLLFEGLQGNQADTTILKSEGFPTTYGEVTEQGIRRLSDVFQRFCPLTGVPLYNRIYYDLGSGIGRTVLGLGLLNPDLRCIGIEIVPDRIKQSFTAFERAKKNNKKIENRVAFYQKSFLDPSIHFTNACWIFISNLCFDAVTQEKLGKKLKDELPENALLLCSKEFAELEEGAAFKKHPSETVGMSWNIGHSLHIYQKL